MIEWIMVFAVLLPIFGGALFPFLPIKNRSAMRIYLETIAGVTSLMAFYLIWKQPAGSFVLFRFTGQLSISSSGCGWFCICCACVFPLAACAFICV